MMGERAPTSRVGLAAVGFAAAYPICFGFMAVASLMGDGFSLRDMVLGAFWLAVLITAFGVREDRRGSRHRESRREGASSTSAARQPVRGSSYLIAAVASAATAFIVATWTSGSVRLVLTIVGCVALLSAGRVRGDRGERGALSHPLSPTVRVAVVVAIACWAASILLKIVVNQS